MINLKEAAVTKCFSLLREFINQTPGTENKKEIATLALNQLQRVTAGTVTGDTIDENIGGNESPLFTEILCEGRPRADGTPPPNYP